MFLKSSLIKKHIPLMFKKTTCILNLNYKNISPVESTSVLSDVSSNVTLMFHVDTESVSVLLLSPHIEDRQKKRLQRGNTQRPSCSLWSTVEMLLLGSSLPPSPLFSPLVINYTDFMNLVIKADIKDRSGCF